MLCVFLAALSSKANLFKLVNLWSTLVPLLREINIYAPTDLFVETLIANNFYLKYFFIESVILAAFPFQRIPSNSYGHWWVKFEVVV